MKTKIHPDYHLINVEMVDGSQFTTQSSYGVPGCTLKLDIDVNTHPAWTGGTQRLVEAGQLMKFNKRFKSFNSNSGK